MKKITTKDKEETDSYILKLTGKAELPESIEINNNFKILIQGAITKKEEEDNERGGRNYSFTFKPVIIETIDHIGKTLKARDSRSDSKLWKAQLWSKWKETETGMNDEQFYHFINAYLRRNVDWIIEQALKEK